MKQKLKNLIPEKLKRAENWILFVKRIVYILCFVWLCYMDHIKGSADGWTQVNLRNYTGIVIGIIIMLNFHPKDFIKLPYFVWLVLFFLGRRYAVGWAMEKVHPYRMEEFYAYMWNLGLYGILVIRMLYRFIVEKKKPQMNWKTFVFWLVMMIGMVIVRPDTVWPGIFLVGFGLFYLTDFRKKDLNNLFAGMIDGIIVGFLLVQGHALLYRPYDEIRYLGFYSNTNINGLFYVFSYTAVLCKWYLMKLKRRPIILRLPLIVLAGMIVGMTVLTMGRTALLTMIAVTALFLLFQILSRRKWYMKIVELLVDSAALLLAIALCFIPTYNMVRYIPAYVDEPLFFVMDEERRNAGLKVEKGDPIDSEKYISFKEVVTQAFSRVLWFSDSELSDVLDEEVLDWLEGFTLKADAAGDDYSRVARDEGYIEPGTDKEHPMMSKEDADGDPARIRFNIYKYYLDHLKPFGIRDGVAEVWVTDYYSAPHAHNILLEIAGQFGGVFGIMFGGLALMIAGFLLLGFGGRKSGAKYYRLFVLGSYTVVLFGFGMLEISWGYGQLPLTMFYFVQYILHHRETAE